MMVFFAINAAQGLTALSARVKERHEKVAGQFDERRKAD
jgi:hypothetical protein